MSIGEIQPHPYSEHCLCDRCIDRPQTPRDQNRGEAQAWARGWNAAIRIAAEVAAKYPEGHGPEYVAYGHIGKGQDAAARDISAAITRLMMVVEA